MPSIEVDTVTLYEMCCIQNLLAEIVLKRMPKVSKTLQCTVESSVIRDIEAESLGCVGNTSLAMALLMDGIARYAASGGENLSLTTHERALS